MELSNYLVIIIAVAGAILLKVFLVRYAYGKRYFYFQQPEELVKEFVAKAKKNNVDFLIQLRDINNMKALVDRNLTIVKNITTIEGPLKDDERTVLFDRVRNLCLLVWCVKEIHADDKNIQLNKYKQLAPLFAAHLDTLKKLETLIPKEKQTSNELRIYAKSLTLYKDCIMEVMTPILFPYS